MSHGIATAGVVTAMQPKWIYLIRTEIGRPSASIVRDDRPFGGTAPAGVFYRYTPDRKGEHPRAPRRVHRHSSG
jgi:hypothetical protein